MFSRSNRLWSSSPSAETTASAACPSTPHAKTSTRSSPQLTASGAKVVLGGITLPPNYGPDYIKQFNETYALLAKKFHAPLLPFLLIKVYGTPGSMQADGIHATAQGNQQVARNLLPLVTPFLKK